MGRKPGVLVAILAVASLLCGHRSVAAGQGPAYRRLMGKGEEGASVKGAVQGARRRLGAERCRQVFGEFTDAAGHTLQANLDALALTAVDYLDQVVFYDGTEAGRCRSPNVLAVTVPGSRAVIVCGARFAAARRHDPRLAEVTIIHETLHTLGLGENPPSGRDITARVFERCGQ